MQVSSRMQSERYVQKFIKRCNSHVQLTTWCCRCDESKHDEVTFQLAAADFGSNSLWQTYLKDNSWISILQQYYKAISLKAWTAMCWSEKIWGNLFKMAGNRFVVHVFSAFWGGGWGYCCSERIWNNYVEIHRKCIHVMLIMVWSVQGYISLDDPTWQREVWRKILLQADPIEGLKAYRKHSFRINLLQCAYFYNTQFN